MTGVLNAALLCSTLGVGAALVSRGTLPVEALTAVVLYATFVSAASSQLSLRPHANYTRLHANHRYTGFVSAASSDIGDQ